MGSPPFLRNLASTRIRQCAGNSMNANCLTAIMVALLRSLKSAQEVSVQYRSPSGGDAMYDIEHGACTALHADQSPPARPLAHSTPPPNLPDPVVHLASDYRIERQATARQLTPEVRSRLAGHRRETVRRVEDKYGLIFGPPHSLVEGWSGAGYSLLFPNSASGEVDVETPGQVTTYQVTPHRPLLIGLSPTSYPLGHFVRFRAIHPPGPVPQ